MLNSQKASPLYEKANEMCPIAGKLIYPESAEFDSSSPSSLMMLTLWSNTTVTLMGSRNTLCCMRSSSGMSRHKGSFITTKPSISTPSENSWLMNLTQTLPHEPSVSSNQDLNIQMTSGPSSIPSSAALTPYHTNLNWTATSSLEPMPMKSVVFAMG